MLSNWIQNITKWVYNISIRRILPKKIGVFNSVAVRDVFLFDQTDVFPEYEGELIRSMQKVISAGDSVVVVGGGRGVSTVISAQLAGDGGSVKTIEASNEQVDVIEETIKINDVSQSVDVIHGLVGTANDVWGEYNEADFI
jgi:predicted O-methyltransferase YrrM